MKFFPVLLFLFCQMPMEAQQLDPTLLQENENAEAKVRQYIFCKVELSKRKAFVQEPIVVTYKLYAALESSSYPLNEPSINNCSAYSLPVKSEAVTEVINNITYNTYELKKMQLYCNEPGVISLDKIKIKNEVLLKKRIPAKEITNVEDMLQHPEQYSDKYSVVPLQVVIETAPEQIEIMALPENSWDGFNGAVGNFTLEGFAEKKTVGINEPVVLHYKVCGKGNFPLLNSLMIKFPPGSEQMEPVLVNSTNNQEVPIKGCKIFTYTILFKDTGKQVIPAMDLVYFDPEARSFRKSGVDSIGIMVTRSLPPKTNTGSKMPGLGNSFFTAQNISWMAAFVVVLTLVIYLMTRKKKKIKVEAPADKEPQTTMQPVFFEKTEKELLLKDPVAAMAVLREELVKAVSVKKGFPPHITALEMLEKLAPEPELKLPVEEIIRSIDRSIYAGGGDVSAINELFWKAKAVVAKII